MVSPVPPPGSTMPIASRGSQLQPSASAPELAPTRERGRQRLQRLLTEAEAGVARPGRQCPQRALKRSRPPGGAPFTRAPAVREAQALPVREAPALLAPGTRSGELQRSATMAADTRGRGSASAPRIGLACGERRSTPAVASRQEAKITSGGLTPRSKRAGEFVKKLVGNSEGDEAMHWRLVQEIDTLDSLMQDEVEKKKAAAEKQRQKDSLLQQVESTRRKESNYRQSMVRWAGLLKADAELFEQEEKAKRQQSTDALRRHNEEQAVHAEANRHRRKLEQEAAAKLEADMQHADVEAKRKQSDVEEKRKKHQQALAMEMADAARVAMRRKVDEKREDGRRDIALMKEQQAMLDEQERQRFAYFDQIREKQTKMQAQYEAGAGNELMRIQKADEERVTRDREERTKKDEAEQRERTAKLKKLQMDGKVEVQRQLDEHAAQRVQAREDNIRLRQEADRDSAKAHAEERTKEQQRRSRAKENAEYLKQQMTLKASTCRHAQEQMTEVEKCMNRDRLDRAKESDNLQQLFRNKLQQYHSGKLAA